jgi:hypothetical protein
MNKQSYWGQFYWGARRESAVECSARLSGLLAELADISHAFGSWNIVMPSGASCVFEISNLEHLAEALLEGRNHSDVDSQPIDELGYTLRLINETTRIEVLMGCYSKWVPNNFLLGPITTDAGGDVRSLTTFSEVVRAVAYHLDPDHGVITTEEYENLIGDDPAFTPKPGRPRSGWMTYVSQRYSVNHKLRANAIAMDYRGHLFVATEEPFDAANNKHAESARRLWKRLIASKWSLHSWK